MKRWRDIKRWRGKDGNVQDNDVSFEIRHLSNPTPPSIGSLSSDTAPRVSLEHREAVEGGNRGMYPLHPRTDVDVGVPTLISPDHVRHRPATSSTALQLYISPSHVHH